MKRCTKQAQIGYIIYLELVWPPGDKKRNIFLKLKGWVIVYFDHSVTFLVSWICILVKNEKTHAGQKSFSTSSHCGKTFADSSTLKQHKRTYTSEKPFCCSNGEKILTQWSTLKEHEKKTGEKPLSCSHCDKTFCQFKCFESARETHTWVIQLFT